MTDEYRWWEDKKRKPMIVNKAGAAQTLGVSLKTVDDWIRKGGPVLSAGRNGKCYRIDITALVEWVRARRAGISIDELRRRGVDFNRRLAERYP
jgi:excisionase family DNA binding protein